MLESTRVYIELFKRGYFDPFTVIDGLKHKKQEEALIILTDNTTKNFAYGGAAGGAKSWTGCTWEVMSAAAYPGTRWFCGREELSRLKESTLITFFKVLQFYGFQRDIDYKYNGQDHFIEFNNGSKINFFELKYYPSDPLYERYGSIEYTGGWIEEAGEVEFGAYDTLKTRIGRHLNDKYNLIPKIFTTLNPKKNWVYQTYWKPFKEGLLPEGTRFLQSFVDDNPFIEKDYKQNLEGIADKVKKQRLLFGNFDYDDDDDALCSYDKICDQFTNSFVEKGKRFLSMDIAITNDKFVCFAWEGLRVVEVRAIKNVAKPTSVQLDNGEWINTVDFTPLLTIIDELTNKWQIPRSSIAYDGDGIGSKLKAYLAGAVPIHNGGKPIHSEFKNLSTELGYKLAECINSDKVFFDCYLNDETKTLIKDELQSSLKRSSKIGDKLGLILKDDVKKLIGHSPDFFDAMKYRMLFLITRRQ